MSILSSLTGGGGLSGSASSTASAQGGSIGNTTQTFGGINTGKQNDLTPLLIVGGLLFVAFLFFRK